MTIDNTTFSGNSTANSNPDPGTVEGGALEVFGVPAAQMTVTNSRFVTNTSTSAAGSGPAVGAAIYQNSGTLTVTESTFTGNAVSGGTAGDQGGAIAVTTGTTSLHYNRFVGNTAPNGSAVANVNATVDASENWWGCNGGPANTGPGNAGCDSISGTVTTSPRLTLSGKSTPATVTGPNATSTITAALTTDSAGGAVAGTNLDAFDALPVTFADPAGDATVTLSAGAHTAAFGIGTGTASIDYHSNTTVGPDPVNTSFDNATVVAALSVNKAPAITSPNAAQFALGTSSSFTVTTTGYPSPTLTKSGALPSGVTFTDNGDGTATLAGTPTAGGSFPITITAANGVSPNATQPFTLTVGQAPAFTSANTATFATGTAGSFAVTTSGTPTVTTITESGTLPSGLAFLDNGNGTATLSGTPAAGTGGTYSISLSAGNGVPPTASQTLIIQVNQAPAVTSNPSDQIVQPGTSVTFAAAASGVPTPTVQWQRSTNGGASFADISGATSTSYTFTTAAGDNGNRYRAVFTNTVGAATTTAATLRVGTAPAFTSANTVTFAVGVAGSASINTSGVPAAVITSSTLPGWLTLTDNHDGTATLTGTPPVGAGGPYAVTLHASNGFGVDATQDFTLLVDESPTITGPDHATFSVGAAGTVLVTTTAGYPTATTLTATGPLPSGVTFIDNHDGTATLAGTPAAGTAGTYSLSVKATATGGIAAAASRSFTLTVNGPPTITSPASATFTVGTLSSAAITTTVGYPTATTISRTGTLPSGVTLVDNGNGSATLSGTPAAGTNGSYPITITASNGIAPDATQSFTLTVTQGPGITSIDHATFLLNQASTFTVTTKPGTPATTTITETGALPAGLTFTDNHDGTATIGGSPSQSGPFPITITAGNGVLPDATQSFALSVNAPVTITSADNISFDVGTAGTLTVTTAGGYPTATTITETGALPNGVSFVDEGNGTSVLSGTPTTGAGGSYPVTVTASNGVAADAVQSLTVTVTENPAMTSADHAAFSVGEPGSFSVTTTAGYPAATTLTESGVLPTGVSFTDSGHGTATLAGTPADGTKGSYPLTITVTNAVGHTDQAFTLTVGLRAQTITVTSIPPASAAVGGSYALAAIADSTLTVAYSNDPTTSNAACSLSGTTVSFDHAGQCVIDFDQAGNGTFAPAARVQQQIAVTTVVTGVEITPSASPSVYGQPITATAAVTAAAASPAGTMQFSLDGVPFGAPVTLVAGRATSPALVDAVGNPLTPGSHPVRAAFTPADPTVYATSSNTLDQVVDQAASATALTVGATSLSAVVTPVAPSDGEPTGSVTFSVGATSVGTVPLSGGAATLAYTVPPGMTRSVSAAYSGDTDFTASSASTSRTDPTIGATLTSAHARTRYGWYNSAVTVTFRCTTHGAALSTPCPAPVVLPHNGAAQSVSRTIAATDGGMATVVVRGINIDGVHPTVAISGVRNGAQYSGAAPTPRCVAKDALSGVASCVLARSVSGTRTTITATATDRAGNRAVTRVSYTTLAFYLAGAPYSGGAFTVRVGHTYTFVVIGTGTRPVYYDAAVVPRIPTKRDKAFHYAGSGRWTLGITMTTSLRTHPYWSIGAKIGNTMHVIKIRVTR